MTTGGFLSPKLYVPRHIWYQKAMIRLPAIEAKINTCNALSQFLDRMATQSKNGELNLFVGMDRRLEKAENERNLVLKELEAFEAITLDHWNKLGKKLSFIQRPGKVSDQAGASHSRNSSTSFSGPGYGGQGHAPSPYHQHRPPHHYQQKHGEHDDNGSNPYDWLQSDDPISATLVSGSMSSVALSTGTLSSGTFSTGLMTSSNLTSSSMSDKGGPTTGNTRRSTADLKNQWKNFSKTVQKTIVNEKIEDTTHYTEILIQLFKSSYLLEAMFKHFESLPPHQTHLKILNRLQKICDFYNMVVCVFVIRDMGELMLKYVKRMGTIVAE
ncbi:hypothetical protein BC939DRAFT_323444 [Gamsiella multidivaricata]|uniref:uncharacterized protein n=1 Tax=Gamsiella multidivaricata TaxID=101098 RepID=UPI00221FDA5E|nr:uncharacterized protein BC939DRAFT_323444 [Gamsiella multidivaricata]KAI7829847.1 hypothetical protein BC939DRAFT_323444 [Gamsiella multidivaricata]